MKKFITYICLFLLLGTALPSCIGNKGKLPSFKETYQRNDKKPLGAFVTYREVSSFYKDVKIVLGAKQVTDSLSKKTVTGAEKHSLYFILTDKLYPSGTDVDLMIDFVRNGNDLFVSANRFGDKFLKSIHVTTNQYAAYLNEEMGEMTNTKVRISLGKDMPDLPYHIYYYPFDNYLKKFDKSRAEILGKDDDGEPNFIILFIGKGRLYLHLAPRALSNYFLLTANNIDYLSHVIDFFRSDPDQIFWDDYYNHLTPGTGEDADTKNFSSIEVIRKNPMLEIAFVLGILGLALFIFSNIKRRQRVIPVVRRVNNASLDFVETISRLYYAHKDNKKMAKKRIAYFYENVRNKYFIGVGKEMDQFAVILAKKKGLSREAMQELMDCIADIEKENEVSDEKLLYLNRLLENFYSYK